MPLAAFGFQGPEEGRGLVRDVLWNSKLLSLSEEVPGMKRFAFLFTRLTDMGFVVLHDIFVNYLANWLKVVAEILQKTQPHPNPTPPKRKLETTNILSNPPYPHAFSLAEMPSSAGGNGRIQPLSPDLSLDARADAHAREGREVCPPAVLWLEGTDDKLSTNFIIFHSKHWTQRTDWLEAISSGFAQFDKPSALVQACRRFV